MALLTQKTSVFSRESNCFDRPPAQQDKLDERLKELEKLFEVSPEKLREITDRFVDVLREGLQKPEQTVVRI